MFESFEWPKTTTENTTSNERETVLEVLPEVISRKEYSEGKLKLDVSFELSERAVLEAKEDEGGAVKAFIKKTDGSVIDLVGFLPEGYRFVTPTSLKPLYMAGGEWFANKSAKVVSIGDMRDAKSVFSLLHEIGHTQETEELPSLNMFRQDSLENLSKSERNAWAKGIRMARQLRQKEDVDLFTLFKDGEDFKKYVYGRLATYKCFAYKSIEQEKSRAPDDISFLRDLFDGEKLDLKKAA